MRRNAASGTGRLVMPGELAKPTAAPAAEAGLQSGLGRQLGGIARALLRSSVGKALVLFNVVILVVIVITAYGQIRLNRWNKPFFDALSSRDLGEVLRQLGVFCIIAG